MGPSRPMMSLHWCTIREFEYHKETNQMNSDGREDASPFWYVTYYASLLSLRISTSHFLVRPRANPRRLQSHTAVTWFSCISSSYTVAWRPDAARAPDPCHTELHSVIGAPGPKNICIEDCSALCVISEWTALNMKPLCLLHPTTSHRKLSTVLVIIGRNVNWTFSFLIYPKFYQSSYGRNLPKTTSRG